MKQRDALQATTERQKLTCDFINGGEKKGTRIVFVTARRLLPAPMLILCNFSYNTAWCYYVLTGLLFKVALHI